MKVRMLGRRVLAPIFFVTLATAMGAAAQDEEMSLEQAAQKTNNPVSDVWLLITQNDYTTVDTPAGSKWRNRTSFQPVMPIPILDGKWNLVNRIITGYVSAPVGEDLPGATLFGAPDVPSGFPETADFASFYRQRTTGNTDTVFFSLAAPNRDDGWIWGVGPTFIVPTATQDTLGQEKWQAGPAGLLVHLGDKHGGFGFDHFNVGVLAQHWWDFAGDDDRRGTNQTDIQYFINWRQTATRLIGMTPNIQIDWKESGSDRFSIPVGLGTIGLFRWGSMPVRWGIEMQYYVNQPDPVGPEWNLKMFIAPVARNPFK